MRNRILFVDDEPMVLDLYRQIGASAGTPGSVLTASNGTEALALLAQDPTDVVVADLELPGMEGCELLTHIERLYPQTMRVVISGHSDRLGAARCLMYGHRYFEKPLEVFALSEALERVCELRRVIADPRVRAIVGGTNSLPTPPETYLRLSEALNDPNADLEEFAEIIRVDAGLTTKLLQIVNSAQFGLGREITTTFEAVQIFGVETLRALMLALQASKFAETRQIKSVSLREMWDHSLQTATGARSLAKAEGLDFKATEECFVAGLLHDIGKLILAGNDDALYGKVLEASRKENLPVDEVEKREMGATHADLGAYLLGLWGLPEMIVSCVQLHHSLDKARIEGFQPIVAVHAAQNLISSHRRAPVLDTAFLERAGCADRVEEWKRALADEG